MHFRDRSVEAEGEIMKHQDRTPQIKLEENS